MLTMMSGILNNQEVLVDKKPLELSAFDENTNHCKEQSQSQDNYEEVFIEGYSILSFETLDDLSKYTSKCQNIKNDPKTKVRRKKRFMSSKRALADNIKGEEESENESRIDEYPGKLKTAKLSNILSGERLKSPEKRKPKTQQRLLSRFYSVPPIKRFIPTPRPRSKSVNDIQSLLAQRICPSTLKSTQGVTEKNFPLNNKSKTPTNAIQEGQRKSVSSNSVTSLPLSSLTKTQKRSFPEDLDSSKNILSHPEMIENLAKLLNIPVDEVKGLIRNPAFLHLYRISLLALSKQQQQSNQSNHNNSKNPVKIKGNNNIAAPCSSYYKEDSKLVNHKVPMTYPSQIKRMNTNNFLRPNSSFPNPISHAANYFKPKAPLVHIQNGIRTQIDTTGPVNLVPRNIILRNEKSEPMQPLNLSAKKSRDISPKHQKNVDSKKIEVGRFDPMISNEANSIPRNTLNNGSAIPANGTSLDSTNNMMIRLSNNKMNLTNKIPKPISGKKNQIKWCDAHVRIAYNIHYANTMQKNGTFMSQRLGQPNKPHDGRCFYPSTTPTEIPSQSIRNSSTSLIPIVRPMNGNGVNGPSFTHHGRFMPPSQNMYSSNNNGYRNPGPSQQHSKNINVRSIFSPQMMHNGHGLSSPGNVMKPNPQQSSGIFPVGSNQPANSVQPSLQPPQNHHHYGGGPSAGPSLQQQQQHGPVVPPSLPTQFEMNPSPTTMEQYYHIFREFCKNFSHGRPRDNNQSNSPSVHPVPSLLPVSNNNHPHASSDVMKNPVINNNNHSVTLIPSPVSSAPYQNSNPRSTPNINNNGSPSFFL